MAHNRDKLDDEQSLPAGISSSAPDIPRSGFRSGLASAIRRPHSLVGWGIVADLLLLIAIFAAIYTVEIALRESDEKLNSHVQHLRAFEEVENSLSRAEWAFRGYLLYREPQFLEERNLALTRLDKALADVQRAGMEQDERKTLQDVAMLVDKRKEVFAEIETPMREGEPLTASERHGYAHKALALIDRLKDAELGKIHASHESEDQTFRLATFALIGSALAGFVLVFLGQVSYSRRVREHESFERMLFELTDSLPGAVYRYRYFPKSNRGRFEFVSRNCELLRGLSRESILRDPGVARQTLSPAYRERLIALIQEHARTLLPIRWDFEAQVPGRGERWFRITGQPVREADGSVIFNNHWEDVTEEKEMEARLHQAVATANAASRAKTSFLATMSHEIRTPMNAMLGMLELMSLGALDAKQRKRLEVVRDSSTALLGIIDDILDFSKVEAGRIELNPAPTSLRQVVDRVLNVHRGSARSKGLSLKGGVDERISDALMVDSLRLQQILNNLVSNAIKFTPSGSVDVRAEFATRDDLFETIRLSVTDSGVGISAEDRERLFEPFTQGAGVARVAGGTGLGLSICQRLAKLMGSRIEVQSRVNEGTTMQFELRLRMTVPSEIGPSRSAAKPMFVPRRLCSPEEARRRGTLLLIVDDHPVNCLVMQEQARRAGFAAEVACDGNEALAIWEKGGIGAILTDISMPGMSGYQLASEIRKREGSGQRRRTAIVACTANAMSGEADNCLAAGMDDYLAKPITIAQLAQTLGRWLEPHGQAENPRLARTAEEALGIDREALREITGGDSGFQAEIVERFVAQAARDADLLSQAWDGRNLARVREVAHRIKGSSLVVGARALAAAAANIEVAITAGNCDEVERLVRGLGVELSNLGG